MLQLCLQRDQRRHLRLGELVDPAVVNEPDGYRIEEVELFPAGATGDHQPGLLQHAQVFHHPEPRHGQLGFQLGQRAAVPLEEPVEQAPPGGIGQSLEDAIILAHRPNICDQQVTCQTDPMQIGVVFPQTEIGSDPAVIRAYAAAVEELGYAHILAYDHVVGAEPTHHEGWSGPYDVGTTFHEPFVLFGYLAAITSLELVTGIIILPQRQTVLVAKQAAEVDVLSEGRLRLGVGLGWNTVEY